MEKRKPDYSQDNKMVVSNNYIRAVHPERMNVNAMKLFRLIVTQCRLSDSKFYEYECKIKDLSVLFETDPKNLYRDVQKLCKNVMQTVLYIGDGNPKHDWEYRTIFSICKYQSGKGIINIKLNDDVTDLFLQLRRNFTQIPISAILTMKSKHAIRLYELICEKLMNHYPYADVSTEIQITLQEARAVTNTEKKKTYDHIGHFKAKVLLPSLKEIEENANWKIIYTDIKRSRSIIGFNLVVWSKVGYEVVEEMKRQGQTVPQKWSDKQVPGQMSLFDIM